MAKQSKSINKHQLAIVVVVALAAVIGVFIVLNQNDGNVTGQAGCQWVSGRLVCGGSVPAAKSPAANCVDTDTANDPNIPGHLVVRGQRTNRDACVSGLFLDQWKCGPAPLNRPETVSRVNCPNGCSVDTSGNARCNGASTAAVCGNRVVEAGEQCDDGAACNDGFQCNPSVGFNICATRGGGSCLPRDRDGCSSSCQTECRPGETKCSGICVNLQRNNSNCGACRITCSISSQCVGGTCSNFQTCGNGIVETNEICDDGNAVDGDECSSDCRNFCRSIPHLSMIEVRNINGSFIQQSSCLYGSNVFNVSCSVDSRLGWRPGTGRTYCGSLRCVEADISVSVAGGGLPPEIGTTATIRRAYCQ